MKRLTILSVLALLVCAVPAHGQGDAKERVRREVDRKQKLMREGKVIRTNVRVTVRLNNGSRLRGVVKQGRMIERHDGLEFVPTDVSSEGAGIRLWYYDNTDSYIFLPFEQIREHTIGERLSDEEVRQLGLELERKARETKERALRKAEGQKPVGPDQPPGEEAPPADAGEGQPNADPSAPSAPPEKQEPKSSLTAEQEAILAEFPPEAGWGPIKKREIELRRIQVHVFPNAQEQRFLDNFKLWITAYEARRTETPTEETGKPATGGDPRPAPAPSPTSDPVSGTGTEPASPDGLPTPQD